MEGARCTSHLCELKVVRCLPIIGLVTQEEAVIRMNVRMVTVRSFEVATKLSLTYLLYNYYSGISYI